MSGLETEGMNKRKAIGIAESSRSYRVRVAVGYRGVEGEVSSGEE